MTNKINDKTKKINFDQTFVFLQFLNKLFRNEGQHRFVSHRISKIKINFHLKTQENIFSNFIDFNKYHRIRSMKNDDSKKGNIFHANQQKNF